MLTGQILKDRYEILNKLGEGAFGETYKARDSDKPSKPFCVVKRLKPVHANQQLIQAFFDKEAAVLEKLGKHPQIPDLLAHFTLDPDLYIVQEFVDGHSLREEMTPGQRLSEGYVTQLLQDVLEILTFVHQNGVIHRDIKPENVMRRRGDGKLVLIDFGVIKELGSVVASSAGSMKTSVVAGTPGYMPSEQALGKPGFYSDVYAVGIMAIEALSGIPPFALPEDPDTGEPSWRDRVQVSDQLAAILDKMVRSFYRQRYPSAIEALQALASPTLASTVLPRHLPIPIPTPSTQPSSPVTPSASSKPSLPLQTFQFEVVRVDDRGQLIDRYLSQAEYVTENLGNGITLELVKIPSGSFIMGSPEIEKHRQTHESPQHRVTIAEFFIGKFPLTQAQYEVMMGKNPSYFKSGWLRQNSRPSRPVETVSWREAIEFCEKLSQRTGRTYRLPSEAEWEYACRAGTTTPFHFGETITSDLANYAGTSVYQSEPEGEYREQTTDVGSFPPNAFGLYDMHGNVWEWCQDVWHENYSGAPTDGRAWTTGGEGDLRLLRGGSWYINPRNCRSAVRYRLLPVIRINYLGFRVVLAARI